MPKSIPRQTLGDSTREKHGLVELSTILESREFMSASSMYFDLLDDSKYFSLWDRERRYITRALKATKETMS